jgi:hypothetical protein
MSIGFFFLVNGQKSTVSLNARKQAFPASGLRTCKRSPGLPILPPFRLLRDRKTKLPFPFFFRSVSGIRFDREVLKCFGVCKSFTHASHSLHISVEKGGILGYLRVF